MRYSVTMVMTDQSISAIELGRAVEARGLDGIWLPDHSHIPISRLSPYPLGGELPARYTRMIDPVVGLALIAAGTERIRVGTGVMLIAQRDPIVTAKALATLDQQSGGRLIVGIGYGWNIEEMADHGVVPRTRRARAREHVLAMRALWEGEIAAFVGEHVTVSPAWTWPKPTQQPLPILVGGAPSDAVFDHVAEFAQGWIPLGTRALSEGLLRLKERYVAAGRDPKELEIVSFVNPILDHRKIDLLESLGATEIAFDIPPLECAEVLRTLDSVAQFIGSR